jgi:hypothetical protein
LKESHGDRLKILDVETKIAKQKKEILDYERFVKEVSRPVTSLPVNLKLIDPKSLKAPEKMFSSIVEVSKKAQDESNSLMEQSTRSITREFQMFGAFVAGPLSGGIDALSSGIEQGMCGAFESVFGEANSLLEQFVEAVLASIARIAAQQLAIAGIAGILSAIPGLGSFGVFASALGSIFHEGGTVPRAHSGMYVNANPNREFPIMVRGGETIRTEAQERELRSMMRGGGPSITLNIGTAIGGRQFVRDALSELRRQTGLSIDTLTQDRSGTIRLGS